MIKNIVTAVVWVMLVFCSSGCRNQNEDSQKIDPVSISVSSEGLQNKMPENVVPEMVETDASIDLQAVLNSYYEAQEQPVFLMFQEDTVQKTADDWAMEIPDLTNLVWSYESFAQYHLLDPDLNPVSPESDRFYYCTFSANNDRFGYLMMSYDGLNLTYMPLVETDYPYDLQAVLAELTDCTGR